MLVACEGGSLKINGMTKLGLSRRAEPTRIGIVANQALKKLMSRGMVRYCCLAVAGCATFGAVITSTNRPRVLYTSCSKLTSSLLTSIIDLQATAISSRFIYLSRD